MTADPRKLAELMRQDAKWVRKQLHPALAHDMEQASAWIEWAAPIVERAREPEEEYEFVDGEALERCRLCRVGWNTRKTVHDIHAPDCPLHEESPH